MKALSEITIRNAKIVQVIEDGGKQWIRITWDTPTAITAVIKTTIDEDHPAAFEGPRRAFCVYYHFVSWMDISLGISIDISMDAGPHIDLHIPFGWIRIGWEKGRYR